MSRRAATFTQADIARALRAAKTAGGGWRVRMSGAEIILEPLGDAELPPLSSPEPEGEPDSVLARGLEGVP